MEENKRSHLAMIQGVIDRMAGNSFKLKEWSVLVMIAVFSFASDDNTKAVIVTLVPLVVFWFLDTYYLMLERKFRCLYDDVRTKVDKEIDFSMNFSNIRIDMKDIKKYGFFNMLISKSVFPFYLVCSITTLIIYLLF